MIAPPPIPNRPAKMPVTIPPAIIAAASSASSDSGTPVSTSGRDVGRFGAGVRHKRDRLAQNFSAATWLDRVRRNVPPERACARHGMEKAEHVPRHRVQPRAARKLTLDVRDERLDRGFGGIN